MNERKPQRMVGKVALVTGAASGIGEATAQRLAAEGAGVAFAKPITELDLAGYRVGSKLQTGSVLGKKQPQRFRVSTDNDDT